MKKLLRSNSGFTLVEMIVAAGVASVIGFIAYTNLKTSQDVGTKIVVDSEVNYLKNLIISTMSSPIACENTFKGSTLGLNEAVQIKDKNNVVIVQAGNNISSVKKDILTITKVSSIASTNSKNNLIITVEYDLSAKLGKSAITKLKNAFNVNVTIQLDSTLTTIESCLVDTTMLLREAVKASCQNDDSGKGAQYTAYESLSAGEKITYPYGKCNHDIVYVDPTATRTVLSTTSIGTQVKTCPTGYFLNSVVTPGAGANKGITEYSCSRISTAPICPAGFFLKTIVSTGVATCESFASSIPLITSGPIPTGSAITLKAGGYKGVDLNCPIDDQVLKRLNPVTGAPECIPKIIVKMCPAGQFVSAVDAVGNVSCLTAPTGTSCPGGQYVMAVTSSGAVSCGSTTIPGSCANGIAGVDGAGNMSCR